MKAKQFIKENFKSNSWGFYPPSRMQVLERLNELSKQKEILKEDVKLLPEEKFCINCNLPTDGEKCFYRRCPV